MSKLAKHPQTRDNDVYHAGQRKLGKRILLGLLAVFMLWVAIATDWNDHTNQEVKNVTADSAIRPDIQADAINAAVNNYRTTQGIGHLAVSPTLEIAAETKCADMIAKGYWAHNAPDGTEPWSFFVRSGYAYVHAGENLAYGFSNSADVVQWWIDSEDHRENLVDGRLNEAGYGICEATNEYAGMPPGMLIVQFLGSR